MEPEGSSPYSQETAWFRGFLQYFVTWLIFYREELLAPRPTTKLEDHHLSSVPDCLFSIFAATLHIWRPFLLHPQPEDAPNRGDREPLITGLPPQTKGNKGKAHPRSGHEGREGEKRYSSTLSLTSALDAGGWLTPRSGRFTPSPGKETR